MNDQQWAYKTKYRVAKAILFTLLFHALLAISLSIFAGGNWEEYVPNFLKKEVPTKQQEQGPIV